MSERQTIAGMVAVLIAIAIAGLFWRRTQSLDEERSPYRGLGRATLIATALAVGALIGWIVFVLASGGG